MVSTNTNVHTINKKVDIFELSTFNFNITQFYIVFFNNVIFFRYVTIYIETPVQNLFFLAFLHGHNKLRIALNTRLVSCGSVYFGNRFTSCSYGYYQQRSYSIVMLNIEISLYHVVMSIYSREATP